MKASFLLRFLRAIFGALKFCHVNRWEWNLILLQGFKFRFCLLERIGLKAARSSQIGGVDVDLLHNPARFRTINKAIEAKYFQKFDFARSRIAILLENDQLTYHDVLASDVFADGRPIVGLKAFGLKPGAHLKIELSDVQREFFSLYSHVPLFKLILSI